MLIPFNKVKIGQRIMFQDLPHVYERVEVDYYSKDGVPHSLKVFADNGEVLDGFASVDSVTEVILLEDEG